MWSNKITKPILSIQAQLFYFHAHSKTSSQALPLTGWCRNLSRGGGGAWQVFLVVCRAVLSGVSPEGKTEAEASRRRAAAGLLAVLASVAVLVFEVSRPRAEGGAIFLSAARARCENRN